MEVVATATAAWRAEARAATELVRMARAAAAAARARPAVRRAARQPTTPAISMAPPAHAFTAVASASLAATERDARRGAARTIRRASTSAPLVGRIRPASGTTSATTAASPIPSRAPEQRPAPMARASIRSQSFVSRRVTPARMRPPCACPDRSRRAAHSVRPAAAITRVRAEVAAPAANALRRGRCAAAR
jgi:hypothetical protein